MSQILEAAAERGLTEGELARRAGAAPETLSRVKLRGDADFGLLVRLSRIVGLRIVAVADDTTLEAVRRGEFF